MGNNQSERGWGTQELVAEARRETEGKYNIMVVKAGHGYDASGIMPSLAKTQEHEAGGVRYKIYAFVEGTFILQGDGGFINWAFYGPGHERDGNTVKFKRITN